MMLLRLTIRQTGGDQHLVGRFNIKNRKEFLGLLNEPWITINDPATTVTTHSLNRNAKGEIQLINGQWATEEEIRQNGITEKDLMLTANSRFVMALASEIDFRSSDISSFRELSRKEIEDYNKAVQAAQLASSNLVTAKPVPEMKLVS